MLLTAIYPQPAHGGQRGDGGAAAGQVHPLAGAGQGGLQHHPAVRLPGEQQTVQMLGLLGLFTHN